MLIKQKGFTIVELLIVIVVIGILAAITIVSYNGIQNRANSTRIASDLAQLEKAIQVARINTGQTLFQIIQNGAHSGGSCTSGLPGGTDVSTLPKTHICWTNYILVMERIEAASEMNLAGVKAGDPYGQPYYLDQNEGEVAAARCTKDIIGSIKRPLPDTMPGGSYVWVENRRNIPLVTTGCS